MTKAEARRAAAALTLSLRALERCRELLINADADADDLAEYDAATEAVRLNIAEVAAQPSPRGASFRASPLIPLPIIANKTELDHDQ